MNFVEKIKSKIEQNDNFKNILEDIKEYFSSDNNNNNNNNNDSLKNISDEDKQNLENGILESKKLKDEYNKRINEENINNIEKIDKIEIESSLNNETTFDLGALTLTKRKDIRLNKNINQNLKQNRNKEDLNLDNLSDL